MRGSPVYLAPKELEAQCRFERGRRSGPGGQNRNKVETAVRFYHDPTGLVGQASERRSQSENRRVALARLRLEIALNVREIPEGAVGFERRESGEVVLAPEVARDFHWFSRLVGGKLSVSSSHFDYPILVSEFFDVYALVEEDLPRAAKTLGTTSSQIVRLLSEEPKALEKLNAARAARGLGRLKP